MILDWGIGIGIHFKNNEEYFETLGYICNKNHRIDVYTHYNDRSGAWSGQGKLHNHRDISLLPRPLKCAFSSSGDDRLSVTDYVGNLVNNHNFKDFYDPTGNMYTFYRFPKTVEEVRCTVPDDYLKFFEDGYNMK